jgi:uncharacterized protein YjbI with pentapeptide repeats
MADPDHLEILQQGVDAWNSWREREPLLAPDLSEADLAMANLSKADLGIGRANLITAVDLETAKLSKAVDLSRANLIRANLTLADLSEANLIGANLNLATLIGANLNLAKLILATLIGADLRGALLMGANLASANLSRADLYLADLMGANLASANLSRADLSEAKLSVATLDMANLNRAKLRRANLSGVRLLEADIRNADLTRCRIYGVSAWNVKLNGRTRQQDLVITNENEPDVTVDNIEVAQFVYLLLHNEKIRDVIDTVGKKGVLLLGRFTKGRIAVLERLRAELRKRGYLPIVFNFDKPETKDFTETVRLLAGLAHFVIADVTNPKSAPLELQATVPEVMVPFRPIIEEGEKPFAMLEDLWIKHRDWVFEPLYYSSLDALVGALDAKIIRPAEIRFNELIVRKAEKMKGEYI